ncbi:MAG: ABC transporter ATP-binding protein [Oscillospiraceae bacterium]|jgi:energy-coupling factor transport system ATP-binding protein|nr:ABC transporter ATP-binding protein [Oscillospiraceae bacterium]
MKSSEPIIVFDHFSFRYESQEEPTLIDISLSIYKGEKVLILGPSGSGKSTLGSVINGLIPAYYKGEISGTCYVNGQEARDTDAKRRMGSVGTVLQDSDAQFVALSVGEDIAFALENQNMPRREMLPLVFRAASLVGMENMLERLPYELSGGQKQKAALAGVLHGKVDILLFDEPLASLDPKAGMEAMDLIDGLGKDLDVTTLIIEHRLEDVLYRPIDRIIVLSEGRIAANGSPDEILKSRVLKSYGIRAPLYIDAMMDIAPEIPLPGSGLDSLDALDISAYGEAFGSFARSAAHAPPPGGSGSLFALEGLYFDYDGTPVLEDINLSFKAGEHVAIMGENGAGKSTLAQLLCGTQRPKKGRVLWEGADYSALSIAQLAQKIGYVMQNPNQMLVKDIVWQETSLALELRNFPKEEAERRVKQALKQTGLYAMRNWPIGALSYGQKKRVTIAVILALEPSVILLDEPTAGQDFARYTELMSFVERLSQNNAMTVLFITHDLHLALEYTRRAVLLSHGRVIGDGDTFDILCNEDLLDRASLKKTSLMTLAQRLSIEPAAFVRRFTEFERERRLSV